MLQYQNALLIYYDGGDACRAYLIRLSRLSRHFHIENHSREGNPALVDAEISLLCAISTRANESIRDLLERCGLYDSLPNESRYNLLFRPDEINFGMAVDDQAEMDCLGRTGLHQALDTISTLDLQYDQLKALMFAQLDHLISGYSLDYINQQDILGRTLLHLACQKGWTVGVRKLLEKGADPSLKTMYGSLPLHYAAASGYLGIATMLQPHMPITSASFMDHRNNTALYYACTNKSPALVELLLTKIHPNIGGTSETPLPFLKAFEVGNKRIVQLLYDSEASSQNEKRHTD
ncbi:hypothetical protein N0V90_012395 [Kalmusia sp. IMI 367209]|nr:hypothetical protein N0V90_012395 [Kalmusia sp. IMI 367209]